MNVGTGSSLGERYELTERIATGGMGEVWRARDTLLHREVAVKLLKREYADDPTFVDRFKAEARHTAGLSHPGIANVYDYGESGDASYLVMELVPGEPLSDMLTREGRLDPARTLEIVSQVATALHAAHEAGVIHRDVKPGNILVTPDGTVKVTDFGIARAADTAPVTQTGTVLGTAHYLSPEQGTGGDVTPASDVYSLGVVTYECLAGYRPFDGSSAVGIAMSHLYDEPPALPQDVPEPARMLVEQSMAKAPGERFATAAAFARAAAGIRERLDGAPPPSTQVMETVVAEVDPPPRHGSRRAVFVALGVAAVLLLLALVVRAAIAPAPEHPVPQLAGRTREQAVAALDPLKLDADTREEASRTVARGRVIRTEPAPGTPLREGSDVVLFVSTGPKPIALPEGLEGRDADAVVVLLEDLGLVVARDTEVSGERRPGTVLRVEPATGLVEGSKVTVVVATQPRGEGKGDKKDEEKKEDD